MPTRLVHLVVDATEPARLARFWAEALRWEVAAEESDEVDVWPPGFSYPDPAALPLVFVPVPEPKTGKNRVHVDRAGRPGGQRVLRAGSAAGLPGHRAGRGRGRRLRRPARGGPVLDAGHRLGAGQLGGQRGVAAVTGRVRAVPGAAAVGGPEDRQEPDSPGCRAVPGRGSRGRGPVTDRGGRGPARHRPGRRAVDRAGRPGRQRVLRPVAPMTPAQARTVAQIEAELARLARYDDESIVHQTWIRQRYDLGAAASYAPARAATVRTAWHEAGHAVAALAVGARFSSASIRHGSGSQGRVHGIQGVAAG